MFEKVPEGIKLDLLSKEELQGEGQLDVLRRYGTQVETTDFCLANGAYCDRGKKRIPIYDETRTFTKSCDDYRKEVITRDSKHDYYITVKPWQTDSCIRPVLRLSPEMFDFITRKKFQLADGVDAVNFGEYVDNVTKDKTKNLEKLYKGRGYGDHNQVFWFNIKAGEYEKKEIENKYCCTSVYKYEGKKYTRFHMFFNRAETTHFDFDGSLKFRLSNGKVYDLIEHGWFEIHPVTWLIDYKTKSLICTKNLISGIQFDDKDDYEGDFENTAMYRFLNDYMLPDLIAEESFEKGKKNPEIEELFEEIAKYKVYYLGNDDIVARVTSMFDDYNKKVNELSKGLTDTSIKLSLGKNDIDTLNDQIVDKLNGIIEELKKDYEKGKPYYDMIEILNGEKDHELKELLDGIKTILDNPMLGNDKEWLLNDFNEIISKNIKRSEDGILEVKQGKECVPFKTLELQLRHDLHYFLIKLFTIVEKKDVVNEIMNGVQAILEDKYAETKNQRAKFLLDLIYEVSSIIRERGNEEDFSRLKELLSFNIDYSQDIASIMKELNEIFTRVYRVELDVKARTNTIISFNESVIDVDMSLLLKDKKNKEE